MMNMNKEQRINQLNEIKADLSWLKQEGEIVDIISIEEMED